MGIEVMSNDLIAAYAVVHAGIRYHRFEDNRVIDSSTIQEGSAYPWS
jgi:hypothetical protein